MSLQKSRQGQQRTHFINNDKRYIVAGLNAKRDEFAMYDPVLLKSFQVVAQEASFTKAAERLNLTQSAVSAHVKRLEEQLERPLFQRSTRSVMLTSDGETFLGYARAILQLNEKARFKLAGKTRTVHIRMGASDDFMSSWLPQVLSDYQNAHPEVSIETSVANTGTLLTSLNRGDLEIVIGSRCNGEQQGNLLWREPLVWAYSKASAPHRSSPVPLALFPEPCPYREAALVALADHGRDWRIAVVSPSVGSLRAAAAAGLAVVPLNRSLLTSQLRALEVDTEMPKLPQVEFMVFTGKAEADGVAEVKHEIIRAARQF